MQGVPSDADEEPPGAGPAHWKFGTTADVGIGARGGSPAELFAQLGQGLTALVTDLERVRPRTSRALLTTSRSLEGLVVAYLTDLIVLFEEEGWLGSRFELALEGDPPRTLRGTAWGELFDPARHPLHVQVKAVTLHQLHVNLARGVARVVVDI